MFPGIGVEKTDQDWMAKTFIPCLCPNCRGVFYAEYDEEFDFPTNETYVRFNKVFPKSPETFTGPPLVSRLSPSFIAIYNQSAAAEAEELYEICGMGYRKALEFLVKDYLVQKFPADEETIKAELLGASIKRIENPQINTLATRSSWIGNDEVHYIRKHDDLDFSDMKRFIHAMAQYIESELTFEEALNIKPK